MLASISIFIFSPLCHLYCRSSSTSSYSVQYNPRLPGYGRLLLDLVQRSSSYAIMCTISICDCLLVTSNSCDDVAC